MLIRMSVFVYHLASSDHALPTTSSFTDTNSFFFPFSIRVLKNLDMNSYYEIHSQPTSILPRPLAKILTCPIIRDHTHHLKYFQVGEDYQTSAVFELCFSLSLGKAYSALHSLPVNLTLVC